jgi:hypothetical protein
MAYINNEWPGGSQQRDYPTPTVPAATFTGGDVVERADARIRYAGRKFVEHRDQVEAGRAARQYDDDYARSQVAGYGQTQAARDADAALAEVEAWRDEAAQAVAEQRAKFTTPLDTASQVAAQRSWERNRAQLEAASNAGQAAAIARNLLANASGAELVTLAEEVQPWLRAKGHPDGWVDDAITKAAPEYAAAKHELGERERKLVKTRHNAGVTRRGYAGDGVDPRTLIPPT